jgi:hypothetical protein
MKVKNQQQFTYCTYPNFEIMYKMAYEDMVPCGAARNLGNNVLVNLAREIFEHKEESDGLPIRYLIKDASLIAFVKKDLYRGIENVPTNGNGFGLAGAVNDNHVTFLCFRSGDGQPIVCAIIFKSERKSNEIPECWNSEINIRKLHHEEILPDSDSQEAIAKLYIDYETNENGALGGGPM